VSLTAAVDTAAHNLSFVYNDLHDLVLLMAVGAGLLAWLISGPIERPRTRRWMMIWAGFLAVVPWLVSSALTAWAGSTESGNRSPFRVGFLITGSVGVALMLLVLLAASRYARSQAGRHGAAVCLLFAAAGTVGLAHKATPILTAERMRIHAVSQRAASVHAQLVEGHRTIQLQPAPLLTVYTQAFDLSFASLNEQRPWLISPLRSYYRIPRSDRVTIPPAQPRDYCLPSVAASWVGVRSCQELARVRR
jgi:uncharacterized membrane protein (DUF4010 family)